MEQTLKQALTEIISGLYGPDIDLSGLDFIPTKKEFEGDITLPVFPLVKQLRRNPKEIAEEIGRALQEKVPQIAAFNVVGGFLNLLYSDDYFLEAVKKHFQNKQYGIRQPSQDEKKLMVEYSSPNTNKPLHLGHIRNNLLGYSVSKIYEATGKPVIKTQIINDRGIHICKSMLAWQKFGNGETPESSGVKGDRLVGQYYVEYNKKYNEELEKIKKEAEEIADKIYEKNQEIIKEIDLKPDKTVNIDEKLISELSNKIEEAIENSFEKINEYILISIINAYKNEDYHNKQLIEKINKKVDSFLSYLLKQIENINKNVNDINDIFMYSKTSNLNSYIDKINEKTEEIKKEAQKLVENT